MDEVIKTERLVLRGLRLEDAADMYEYTRRPEVSRFLTWYPHLDISQDEQFIKEAQLKSNDGNYYFGIVLPVIPQKLIGSIHVYDISKAHKRCEISYILNPVYSGKGYAAEAVKALIQWIFSNLGLRRIQALCILENAQSENLMKRCGMECEGILKNYAVLKDGKSYAMKLYSICREEQTGL